MMILFERTDWSNLLLFVMNGNNCCISSTTFNSHLKQILDRMRVYVLFLYHEPKLDYNIFIET